MNSLVITTLDIDRDLLNSIAAEAEVIVLDSTENIQERITEILGNYNNLSNIHFVLPEKNGDRANTELDRLLVKELKSDRDRLSSWLQGQSLLKLRQSFAEDATIFFHEFNPQTNTFDTLQELAIADSLEALEARHNSLKPDELNNSLETRLVWEDSNERNDARLVLEDNNERDDAAVTTDLDDYPPGATAIITGENFDPGETIELQVLHTDDIPNTGGGHEPWQITDGGAGDLDGKVDGKFKTIWYVNPDDSANSAFKLTATGLNSGEIATRYFTDSDPAVQFFYIPKKEADIRSGLYAVNTAFGLIGNIRTVVSLTVSTDNTIIYYDHWEDGYESDLNNPTQSTTKIWGDNDPSNGIPPGYTTDVLNAGNIITLDNVVNVANTATTIDYDGEDKIGASKAIVVSRAYWPDDPNGPLIAEASNVYDTSKWGLSYKVPLGENFTSSVNFEYTSLFVTTSKNNTTLTITGADTTGDNVADGTITTTLNEGQSYFLNGGVLVGTTVTASNPIQAHLLTGDIGSNYATRAYTLVPTNQWGISYYTPVGTVVSGKNTDVFLYNPDASGSITVNYQTQTGTGTVSVPAGTVVRQTLPVDADSGAHFYTTNSNDTFFATTAFDSEGSAHDWGFSLIPEENLTPIIQVGWGPGNGAKDQNGNPLWVMATAPTTIYVDYDGDGIAPNTDINGTQYDASFSLGALEAIQITDTKNNDFDQSGIRVYTVDGTNLAGAWGQDANAATAGTSLDLGTEILPLPIAYSWKEFNLVNDVNGDGNVDPGDTIEFTINIKNDGVVVLGNVNVSDIIPAGTTYISSSTKVDGNNIGDDTSGTAFPFDDDNIFNNIDDGLNIGNIPVGGSANVTFRMLVNNPYDGNLNGITNSAAVDSDEDTLTVAVNVPVDIPTKTKTLYLSDNSGFGGSTTELDRTIPTNPTAIASPEILSPSANTTAINVTDDFESNTYTGGTGWDADWVEREQLSNGGLIKINGGKLEITPTTVGDFIQRKVNLNGVSTPVKLRFDVVQNKLTTGSIKLQGSTDGGKTFTDIATLNQVTGTGTNKEFNLSTALGTLTADTVIRFQSAVGQNQPFQIDNLNIINGTSSQVAADNFDTGVYTGGTGWTGNWSEFDQDTDQNAGTDKLKVAAGDLQLTTNYDGAFVQRELNLDGATSATLNFNVTKNTLTTGTERILLKVSTDGGYTFTTINTFDNTNVSTGAKTFDLISLLGSGSLTADTVIRFEVDGTTFSGKEFDLEDITVDYSTPTAGEAVDNLNSGDYSGGTNWKGNWVEFDSGGSGPTAGEIQNLGSELELNTNTNGDYIERAVDLANVTSANLTFNITDTQLSEVGAGVLIRVSTNGGTSFTNIGTLNSTIGVGTQSFDLTNSGTLSLTDNTVIRFEVGGDASPANDRLRFDDVRIFYEIPENPINQLSFTQTPTFASDFDLVSGTIPVTTFVEVTGGTPTTSSAIEATLLNNGTEISSLTSPSTVTNLGSGIYQLDWNLPIGNTTISQGEALSLNLENTQPGLGFKVLYDGNTRSSQIDLPTRSVIDITSIGIYDDSYANGGGNLVNAAADGDTVYLRVEVEDPFGDYDITGLDIDITDPNSGLTTINLDDTDDVDTTTDGKRIYEYPWTPTTALGDYTIDVTAKEGYENTITATDSTTLNLNDGNVPDVIIGDATAIEGNQLAFDVSLSTASTSDIILDLTTTDGTATGISDYETDGFEYSTDGGNSWITAGGTNGTRVTIPAGNTNIKVRIDSVSDSSDEPNETFILGVKSVISGSVGNTSDTGTGTITDDDPTPSISISDVSLTEGNSNSKQFTFTVSLSNASSQTVSVNYATANGTATTANNDYTSATGTLSFAPGETTKAITVNVTGDTTQEPDETFVVNLSNATNATISDSQGTGTILNDDNIALLAINNVSITEGNSGTKTLTFTVIRSGLTTSAVTVNYATADNTATTANSDYVSTSGTLSFASGETSKTISVTINGDTPPEADETFYVNLSNASNATITDSQGTGTILNDDASGTITGRVLADTNNDNTGDSPLSGVTIELKDTNGDTVDTTTTDSNGDYSFEYVTPGTYNVVQTNLTGYGDVSEVDGGDDSDNADNGITNSIPVTLAANETDSGNNFVDEQLGTISGTVLEDTNNDNIGDSPLSGVTIELLDENGNPIDSDPNTTGIQPTTTTTNSNGNYSFTNVAPGTYQVVETDPAGYVSVKDSDSNGNNNLVDVTLATGGSSTGNDFVDEINSLNGTEVSEILVGTADNDFITGYKGQDTLTGGGGNDSFYFNETSESVDIITDFNDGDRIVLSQILDNEVGYNGTDPIGDGYVVIDNQGSVGTMIQIDFDAGNESTPTDLFHKDLVFLQGVAAASIDSSDFIF